MLNELRGRNLAHVGCTVGLTLGLALGLVAALVIAILVRTASAVDVATLVWFAITGALGALGYWLGGRVSRRLWGAEMDERARERQ